MSVKKNVASTIIVLAIIAIAAYGLFSLVAIQGEALRAVSDL
jgi:hypothetical protein